MEMNATNNERETNMNATEHAANAQDIAIAQEIVCDIPGSGYWSGDDWYCSDEIPFTARLHFLEDDSLDKDKTWQSIITAFDAAVAPWDEAASEISEALERAAGWEETSEQEDDE